MAKDLYFQFNDDNRMYIYIIYYILVVICWYNNNAIVSVYLNRYIENQSCAFICLFHVWQNVHLFYNLRMTEYIDITQ